MASIQTRAEADRVILSYRHRGSGEEWKDIEYPVLIEWTACNYGGRRAWFRCPAAGCGRRVAILYGGKIFACRHCYKLAYESQREGSFDRMIRKADKIRDRLGWEPGVLNYGGGRPKGMRRQTYWRLCFEHNKLVDVGMRAITQSLGMRLNSIGKSLSPK